MAKPFNRVYVEISNICNLQCSFCPEVIRSKKLMDLEIFTKVARQVAPLTNQVAFHLMGDPLVHPKLKEFVDVAKAHGLRIYLVTNGTLLNEQRMALLLDPVFEQVNFSLHSFHDNFPNRDPSEYLGRIFDFTEQAFLIRPDLYINYRLWNLQTPKGSSLQNQEILKCIETRFDQKINSNLDVRQKKGVRVLNRLYLHFDTEFTWPALDLPKLGDSGTCYGLSSHFGILADGTVVPCCLDKEAGIPLGNIQESAVTEILASARAKNILNGFKKRRLIEDLCQRCQYIERFK